MPLFHATVSRASELVRVVVSQRTIRNLIVTAYFWSQLIFQNKLTHGTEKSQTNQRHSHNISVPVTECDVSVVSTSEFWL